jgi:hypothetical protein
VNTLKAGSIPTAAESFDQGDRRNQLLAQELRGQALIIEQGLLRRDYIQVGD